MFERGAGSYRGVLRRIGEQVRFQINSEFLKLEVVLLHRPGGEIDRLTHENMRQFLFEDVPYLRRMQNEHDAFADQLRDHGIEVLYLESLLSDVLGDADVRKTLVQQVCDDEVVPALAPDLTDERNFTASELVELLFSGLTAGEYADAVGRHYSSSLDAEALILGPIPNAYFSRDPAVVVRDAVISSKMHYRERVRETLLTRCVLENHPDLKENTILYGCSNEPSEDRPYTVEGGDVLVLTSEALLIGCSERTRSETIQRVAAKCFRSGPIRRVYEIPIPSQRAFMHLDTVMTVVDRGKILWFADVMEQLNDIHRYEPSDSGDLTPQRLRDSRGLLEILSDEFGQPVITVDTAGGRKPFAGREQRMDGANALAIAPGVVVTYERNEHTAAALEKAGVMCLTIPGAELVRGLGGPRCMTMPLRRETAA